MKKFLLRFWLIFILQNQIIAQETMLKNAIHTNDLSAIKTIITKKSDVDWQDSKGETPLMSALYFCDNEVINYLLALNPNLHSQNHNGCNALYFAVEQRKYEICKILISRGADICSKRTDHWTPLHASVYSGNIKIIKLLLSHSLLCPIKITGSNLQQKCLISIIENYKTAPKKTKNIFRTIKDVFLTEILSIALKKMKFMLTLKTKQRGDCLKIAYDENYKETHSFIQNILAAKELNGINDQLFIAQTKKFIAKKLLTLIEF